MRKVQKKRGRKNHKKQSIHGLPVLRPNVAGIDTGSRTHYVAGPIPKTTLMQVNNHTSERLKKNALQA